jgi:hypothetical protein
MSEDEKIKYPRCNGNYVNFQATEFAINFSKESRTHYRCLIHGLSDSAFVFAICLNCNKYLSELDHGSFKSTYFHNSVCQCKGVIQAKYQIQCRKCYKEKRNKL